ncbi:hypothetical protein HYT58_01925 [Candidatus Woesearchaeota archaeon]|nr:hypothetical protein [Candidatus Woesearchaeota archaeon]
MQYTEAPDFIIPERYRGTLLLVRLASESWLPMNIPRNAVSLDVNPLEDEEEFLGYQCCSDRQQLIFRKQDGAHIQCLDLERRITTEALMVKLEKVFQKNY